MPQTITTTVYQYAELSEAAQEKARDWFREATAGDTDTLEFTIDDAVTIGELLGITFDTKAVPLYGGGTRYDPVIWYNVGFSQSDGASFAGRYEYRKGAAKAIREHAPQDTELHRIADDLQAIQRKWFYALTARIEAVHNESTVDARLGGTGDYKAEEELGDIFRTFAGWIYNQLRAEVEYQSSDEVVTENIIANEYTFDAEGNREG